MSEPRQRNIPLNINERRELDRRKQEYEHQTGDAGDWGRFLAIATLAGLAALGIYKNAQATRRAPTLWQVDCPRCPAVLPIRVPNPPPMRMTQVTCPDCKTELVIDFAGTTSSMPNGHQANESTGEVTDYGAYCPRCRQPIQIGFSVKTQGIELVRCPSCDNVATYGLMGVE